MIKKRLSVISIALFCAMGVKSQVGINTVTPDNSAALDVVSKLGVDDSPRGFLPPRVTLQERDQIAQPATGLVIYNTSSNSLQYNFGTPTNPKWMSAVEGSGSSASSSTDWFYMPVTALSTASATSQSIDLYAEYKRQFDLANAGGALNVKVYAQNEIEFYIIGYDTLAFPTISLSTEGMLTYTPDPTMVSQKSYLNVIIKIK